jgi:hypothetical protein
MGESVRCCLTLRNVSDLNSIAWEYGPKKRTYVEKIKDIVDFLNNFKEKKKDSQNPKHGDTLLAQLYKMKREDIKQALVTVETAVKDKKAINIVQIFKLEPSSIPGAFLETLIIH